MKPDRTVIQNQSTKPQTVIGKDGKSKTIKVSSIKKDVQNAERSGKETPVAD